MLARPIPSLRAISAVLMPSALSRMISAACRRTVGMLVPGGESAMQARAVAARREKLAANAQDPSYTLVMQTGSSLTASAISRAIRADR